MFRISARSLSFLFAGAMSSVAQAQIPTKCFEIESILVDACISSTDCPGSQEGQNEMVRFRTGPDAIALDDIVVEWPNTNNNWLGFVQDASTAALTATLNATIESCGQLLEPTGGVIPPGSGVLMVTSTDMCVEANAFTNLGDTLFIVYQAPGNTAGHFANHTNGGTVSPTPTSASALRTMVMAYLPTACGDTATYDRSLLVNVYGTYGGVGAENDGATAQFTWPGVPVVSYVNFGCQAPIVPVGVSVEVDGDLCGGSTVDLEAVVSGPFTGLVWTGGSGTFSDPTGSNTSYTAGAGDVGSVQITVCALGVCEDPVCATVDVPVGDAPLVEIASDGPLTLCPGETLELTASGADDYSWSSGQSSSTITVTTPGNYTVTGTNACGTASASVTVGTSTGPQVSITSSGTLCPDAVLSATGADSYLWSTGASGASITVDSPGTYTVVGSTACGADSASIVVEASDVSAAFQASTLLGDAPLPVQFTNTSQPASASFFWEFGDGVTSTVVSPSHVYTQPGVYTVSLTATDVACADVAMLTIIVRAPVVDPSSVTIPNVFSPNGDGMNDVWGIIGTGLASLDAVVYNRWGQEVARLSNPAQVWDGRTGGGLEASDGTYFYILEAVGADGKRYEFTGSLTLLR